MRDDKNLAHVVPLMAFLVFMGVMGFVVGNFEWFFSGPFGFALVAS